ncbi:hypothetical protein SAY87_019137 [Trapa incisa]|uniref:Uncharacterized protein n=1 Tax=Trapa incisa TaxID=236973 RepID=A0AAN7K3H8_9MYRT|nr:hypothetical protein SAY87_019137 [Trapa incisa]
MFGCGNCCSLSHTLRSHDCYMHEQFFSLYIPCHFVITSLPRVCCAGDDILQDRLVKANFRIHWRAPHEVKKIRGISRCNDPLDRFYRFGSSDNCRRFFYHSMDHRNRAPASDTGSSRLQAILPCRADSCRPRRALSGAEWPGSCNRTLHEMWGPLWEKSTREPLIPCEECNLNEIPKKNNRLD